MLLTCIYIFFARILDVSIGTIKMFYSVKGKTIVATILAFLEVLIWFLVARKALNTDIVSFWIPISYSLGYATGTYLGTLISNRYIKGILQLKIITQNLDLPSILRKAEYHLAVIKLDENYDNLNKIMILLQLNNHSLNKVVEKIRDIDKDAFIMLSDTKLVYNGSIK